MSIFVRFCACVCECHDFGESLHLHSRKSLFYQPNHCICRATQETSDQNTREHRHVHGLCDVTCPANHRFVTEIPALRWVPSLIEHVMHCVMLRAPLRHGCPETNRSCASDMYSAKVAAEKFPRPLPQSFAPPAVEFLVHEAETSQVLVDSAVVVVAGWDYPEEHREKVDRHRRLHPQPWHPFFHEGRVPSSKRKVLYDLTMTPVLAN